MGALTLSFLWETFPDLSGPRVCEFQLMSAATLPLRRSYDLIFICKRRREQMILSPSFSN